MEPLQLQGIPIAVYDVGKGPPVVAVHSSGLAGLQWRRLAARLSRRHRVLAPDLLGYGATGPWPDEGTFSIERNVDLVEAVVQACDEPVHLVGHSYGGLLALKAAARAPERVRSLALYEPVAFGVLRATKHEAGLASLATVDRDGGFFEDAGGGGEGWMRRFIEFWNGPGSFDALPAERRAALLATGRKTFLEVRGLSFDDTPDAAYAPIDAPTLLLHGTTSPVAARAVCDVLSRTLPRARVATVEGAGHMGPLEQGERVNALVQDHLDGA